MVNGNINLECNLGVTGIIISNICGAAVVSDARARVRRRSSSVLRRVSRVFRMVTYDKCTGVRTSCRLSYQAFSCHFSRKHQLHFGRSNEQLGDSAVPFNGPPGLRRVWPSLQKVKAQPGLRCTRCTHSSTSYHTNADKNRRLNG